VTHKPSIRTHLLVY